MFHKLGSVNKQVDKLQSSQTLNLWLILEVKVCIKRGQTMVSYCDK